MGSETSEQHNNDPVLENFHGDLSWVHAREGHAGKAYWPGGASGVTLDPGMDLGHASSRLIETAYADILTSEQMQAASEVFGIKGEAAKTALQDNAVLKGIRISRAQADKVFPYAARPYWEKITRRFEGLLGSSTPGSVQTALLSLAYNRGAGNKGLNVLSQPIADGNWQAVADLIGSMQQDHRLEGIRKRRRMEAALIVKELNAAG